MPRGVRPVDAAAADAAAAAAAVVVALLAAVPVVVRAAHTGYFKGCNGNWEYQTKFLTPALDVQFTVPADDCTIADCAQLCQNSGYFFFYPAALGSDNTVCACVSSSDANWVYDLASVPAATSTLCAELECADENQCGGMDQYGTQYAAYLLANPDTSVADPALSSAVSAAIASQSSSSSASVSASTSASISSSSDNSENFAPSSNEGPGASESTSSGASGTDGIQSSSQESSTAPPTASTSSAGPETPTPSGTETSSTVLVAAVVSAVAAVVIAAFLVWLIFQRIKRKQRGRPGSTDRLLNRNLSPAQVHDHRPHLDINPPTRFTGLAAPSHFFPQSDPSITSTPASQAIFYPEGLPSPPLDTLSYYTPSELRPSFSLDGLSTSDFSSPSRRGSDHVVAPALPSRTLVAPSVDASQRIGRRPPTAASTPNSPRGSADSASSRPPAPPIQLRDAPPRAQNPILRRPPSAASVSDDAASSGGPALHQILRPAGSVRAGASQSRTPSGNTASFSFVSSYRSEPRPDPPFLPVAAQGPAFPASQPIRSSPSPESPLPSVDPTRP
ncbi:hypothetical protein HK405_003964 [Cladochytrium tenue]|nr:hypothetical protein HK405_003964 [Cladochytrium tenue]